MRPPSQSKGLAPNEPSPNHIPSRSGASVQRTTADSQLRELPGETWEDIFAAQPEPTLDDALRDPALQAAHVDRYGELVDEPAAEQPSSETNRKIAKREGRCRYCGGTVFWSVTEKNHKPMPLDPEPSGDPCCGNFVLVEIGGETLARYVSDARRFELIAAGNHVWIAHAASCSRRRAA